MVFVVVIVGVKEASNPLVDVTVGVMVIVGVTVGVIV